MRDSTAWSGTVRGASGFVVAAIVSACGGAAADDEYDLDELPLLVAQESRRIGDADDPDVGLSRPYGLDVDADGQVYVIEGADMQIRVYDADGRVVRRIGRRGEGPGEFSGIARFGVQGDTVWAYDAGLRRITLFRRDGTLLLATGQTEEIVIPLPRCFGYVVPWSMRPDGRFSGEFARIACSRTDPATGVSATDSIPVPRVAFDVTGATADTIGWDPSPPPRMYSPPSATSSTFQSIEVNGRRMFVPDPPPTTADWIALHDGRIIIDMPVAADRERGVLTVTRLDLARDTVYSRRLFYRPDTYSDAELDAIAAAATRGFGGMEMAGGGSPPPPDPGAQRALRDAMKFPEFKLPIEYVQLDGDERVWLTRRTATDAPESWILLDAAGVPQGRIELPPRSRFLWSRGSTLWVIEPDGLDVPWLVQYTIERG